MAGAGRADRRRGAAQREARSSGQRPRLVLAGIQLLPDGRVLLAWQPGRPADHHRVRSQRGLLPLRGRVVRPVHRAGPDPVRGHHLAGYFYRGSGAGARPTVVIHSGFDGTVEESHFFGAAAFAERGYHVLSFDGPGQPGMMHREGMVFRPDWETVVGPVLDYLLARPETDPDRVALMGISLGGVLAPRAAAFDPRIEALVAFDGVYNLG